MIKENGWYILIRCHDHIWRDKNWSLQERCAVCDLLFRLSLTFDKKCETT